MDLSLDPEEARFAEEARSWLAEHVPSAARAHDIGSMDEVVARGREWQAQLAAAGWVGIDWPVEYGGRGASPVQVAIFNAEYARARAPQLVNRVGINLAAPTLLAHGSPEQCRRLLPKIATAEEIWCQLFSEPGAGSDLTGLSTRAVPGDGGWYVTGQKIWTSYARYARFGICLARSEPGSRGPRGLSLLAVEMSSPGVDIRPLVQMTGEAEFNEVLLDGVVVPAENLVGALGEGWRVAGSTLSHERGVNPRQLVIHMQHAEELLRLAERDGAFANRRLARRLAQAYSEVKLFQLLNWRTLSRIERGAEPGPEGSVSKIYWSEMSQRLHTLAMDILGPAAPLWADAAGNPSGGTWQRSWLYYQAASIFAGTNEIQRNVVAERVLGLPREPSGSPRFPGTSAPAATAGTGITGAVTTGTEGGRVQ